jgi:hypothetical protein
MSNRPQLLVLQLLPTEMVLHGMLRHFNDAFVADFGSCRWRIILPMTIQEPAGVRPRVVVTVYGRPFAQSFQGPAWMILPTPQSPI